MMMMKLQKLVDFGFLLDCRSNIAGRLQVTRSHSSSSLPPASVTAPPKPPAEPPKPPAEPIAEGLRAGIVTYFVAIVFFYGVEAGIRKYLKYTKQVKKDT